MAKKRKKRLSRKEVLAPDEFLTKSRDFMVVVQDYWKQIAVGLGAVVVITAIALTYQAWVRHGDEAASMDLGAVVEILDAPIVEEGEDPPEGPDGKPVAVHFASEADRHQAALEALDALVRDHAGTKLAMTARLLQADVHLAKDDTAGAIAAYEAFLADAPDVPFLRYLARENLGYAYEDAGDIDAALTQFEQLRADLPDNPMRDEGLFQVGRLQQHRGDKDAARAAFAELVEKFPDSRLTKLAEARLVMLEVGGDDPAAKQAPEEAGQGGDEAAAPKPEAAPAPKPAAAAPAPKPAPKPAKPAERNEGEATP